MLSAHPPPRVKCQMLTRAPSPSPMRLSELVRLRRPTSASLDPEDILGSALAVFDDVQNQHGEGPQTVVLYDNARHGTLALHTADVQGEDQRRNFAHYLWNAGLLMAELVGGRPGQEGEAGRWLAADEECQWHVAGETVLELGAGVGLGGIVSALAGAQHVAVTDYPASPILDTIRANVAHNVPSPLQSRITVHGHGWGAVEGPFETVHAHRYTRILAADCLWMPGEHDNLAASMAHFLAPEPCARVLCIAGFHTGRAKVASFFEQTIAQHGLEVDDIFELDVNGVRRPWAAERDGGREDIVERKKWLVLARLRRAAP